MIKKLLVSIYAGLHVFSCLLAQAGESIELPDIEESTEHVLDKRQNYFLTSTDYKIAPKVNPVTGEYCEEELDLVVAGSEPLSVRRFYNSGSPYDPRYATWRYNPEAFLVANIEWQGQEIFAAVGDFDGSVSSFTRADSSTFNFQPSKGFAISGSDGTSHPLNTKIQYRKKGDPKDKHRYEYRGTITDGSGRTRSFISAMHRWTHYVHWTEKKGSWLTGWSEKTWRIHANTWTPFHIPITEEKLPNGNLLVYTYTQWKKEKKNFPLPKLLGSITAYNADKTQVLGTIKFQYPRDKHDEVIGIQVTGSDGRTAFMHHQVGKKDPIKLTSAKRPGIPLTSYSSDNTNLKTIAKPEGRILETEYNSQGKVSAQYAPVGPNGEKCPIGRYEYQDNLTIFYDAENNKTHYRYDADKKLTAIESFQGNALYRIDRFTWDRSTGNLIRKTVENQRGVPIQITEFQYDKNQNPIMERVGDGKEWRTITRTYSNDGFNLKLTATDRPGKLIRYAYIPGTNLLASELIYENQTICKRTFHTYDDCAICIKTVVDDGSTEEPDNLRGVTYRKITVITPKKSLPCFGLPEVIEEKTIDSAGQEILLRKTRYTYTPFGKILQEDHYDANNAHHHTITNTYDDQERLISTTDPLGHTTCFTYDANHNLISIAGPRPDQYKEIAYDKANRPIRIADWQTDGTILFLEKKYDKLGRLIEEIDACKNSTLFTYDSLGRVTAVQHPNGAIERKEYDILGNLIRETDPKGYTTTKTYNNFGQAASILYSDGSEELFTYDSTGTLKSHTDANGCTIMYTYDAFDRPIKETYLFNSETLKTKQALYTTFCKLSETDGEGNTIHYTYDFSGRKIEERAGAQTIRFTYDACGNLQKTDHESFEQIEAHDLAGRLISKSLCSGAIQFQEKFAYDEASNPTHLITSHGAFETLYDNQGKPLLETNPAGHQTTYAYRFDADYREIITDANQIQTTRIHDNRGREIARIKTNPQGDILSKSESLYDSNGNLSTLTHYVYGPESVRTLTHTWEYGPQNRLERFIEAGEKETRYLYDEKGRLKTHIKPSGNQLHYEYDSLGRLSRYFSSDFDYRYTYDRNDRLLSVYDAVTQTATTRTYNELGAIIQETLGTGLTFCNSYDNQGRRTQLTLPDNSEITYAYQGAFLHRLARNGNACTYAIRDLEGHPVELELPAHLGTIAIKRDLLSRIAAFASPAYNSRFPHDAYDPVGNLLNYVYEDPLGKVECTYTYDQLNQLISENEHTYLYDSLHNRLKKDEAPHLVNALCQIVHDGSTAYEYDPDGNLIFDGDWHYTYDTQDRLIEIENGKMRIEYTYDPFHRRLSKTVFLNKKRAQYERYLWDGDNEIGTVDQKGKITQLRVLGEGLGAEIGAAVLYELNGKTYVPIHNHRGDLVVLIDAKTQKHVETCRYTAFGEELIPAAISPWRFSSKRVEEERGLVFFGRRYYFPQLGRWITHDPQGFDDGPNLYAYLSNCPLISVDPYGLMHFDSTWFRNDRYMQHTLQDLGNVFGFARPIDYSKFENRFNNKSRAFDLNQDFGFDFKEPPVGAYLFGNGIGNTFDDIGEKAYLISTYTGYNTRGVYNATHNVFIDSFEACANLNKHAMTPPVYIYHQEWDRYFDNNKTGAPLWQGCHSQGAAQVRNALENYPKERRNRIIVAAFAPLAYISKELCMQVNHYVCPSDDVPNIDRKGRRECRDTITYIPKMQNCKQSCHEFLNPIYLPYIQEEIRNYQAEIQKYVR